MNFSVNQVRHLYVVKDVKNAISASSTVASTLTTVGDGAFPASVGADDDFWLYYKNAASGIVRSDIINKNCVMKASATGYSKIAYTLKGVQVSLTDSLTDGVEYILGLTFRQYIGLSEEDQRYVAASFKVFNSDTNGGTFTASDLYKHLAVRLAANLSNVYDERYPLCTITLSDGTEVTGSTDIDDLDGTYTYIQIMEAAQEYIPGRMAQGVIPFIVATPASVSGQITQKSWATIEKVEGDQLPEGEKIVDLEIFTMGERGDMYHQTDWPASIPVKYLAEPDKLYDVINIHYFTPGSEGQGQRSEKDLQIAVLVDEDDHSAAEALIEQLENLGVSVTKNGIESSSSSE